MPQGGDHALLEVRDLGVRIGDRQIVESFDFSLVRGETVGLLGPSGGGKTTLLRALVGLVDASSGEVLLDGERIKGDAYPGFRRRVVWVSQTAVMPSQTVEQALRAPFSYRSSRSNYERSRAVALLESVGLGARYLDDSAEKLSEGQKKRVALVRGLLIAPDALLLDEPTSGLDEPSISEVEDLLTRKSQEDGLACVLVTHDASWAARFCDRVVDLAPFLRGTQR